MRDASLRFTMYTAITMAFAAMCQPAGSQTLNATLARRIDAAVIHVLTDDRAPSASIAIVSGDRLVYAAAYGKARLSPTIRATTVTRYQVASISKTLTAQVLLLLEQEGRLSLDEPVSRWFPDLTGADRITVRNVLAHTSGYPDHYPQTYPAGRRTQPITPDEIIGEWGSHPLLFEPGTRFRYSNFNYVIAGRIAEKAAGEPLFSILGERVLAPLGMNATINLDDIDATTPNVAIGYVRPAIGALQPAPEEGRGWSYGAGQVVATASDIAHWDEAFLSGRLLASKQAHEEITTPKLEDGTPSPYALGLFVSQQGGRRIYYHIGQGLGFLAINRIYPDEHAALVVLTNDSSSSAFAHIAERLAYLILPPSSVDAQARAVFHAIQTNSLDRRRMAPDFNAYFDAAMARKFSDSLRPLGEPDSFDLRDEDRADGLTTRVYSISAGGKRLRIIEQILSDGLIESFQVQAAD